MSGWLWLSLGIAATACGQLLFKHARMRLSRNFTLAAIAVFVGASLSMFMALHSLSLATVYVCTAISQLLVVLASMLLFKERYVAQQWTGLGLILAGVILFNIHIQP